MYTHYWCYYRGSNFFFQSRKMKYKPLHQYQCFFKPGLQRFKRVHTYISAYNLRFPPSIHVLIQGSITLVSIEASRETLVLHVVLMQWSVTLFGSLMKINLNVLLV